MYMYLCYLFVLLASTYSLSCASTVFNRLGTYLPRYGSAFGLAGSSCEARESTLESTT